MAGPFFSADLHLGHQRVCDMTLREDGTPQVPFTRPDGTTPLRPFKSVAEMNAALVDNWNSVVGDDDHAYLLGDAAMTKRWLPLLAELKGKITFVPGNHDTMKVDLYRPYFHDIVGVKVLEKARLVLTHIPIHTACVDRFGTNVHGHMHAQSIPDDPRYICVSVEQTNFTPISLDEIMAIKESHG